MRSIFLPILILFSFSCFAQGTNGLMAHWTFNGNANDSSGNGVNGVVHGGTLTTGKSGLPNTAYYFNGTNAFISVPYNPHLNVDTGSICILLKVSSFYSGPCQTNFVLKRGHYIGGGSGATSPDFYNIAFSDNYYDTSCSNITLSHEVFGPAFHTDTLPPMTQAYYADSDTIVLNKWFCITTTYSHDSCKLYLDGILKKTVYMPDNYAPGTDSLVIGFDPENSSYPYWFNGSIDDMRLYNRPLSAAEAMAYCDTAKGITTDVSEIQGRNSDLLIAPNPAQNLVSVLLPDDNAANAELTVLNMMGQKMLSIKPAEKSINIDIHELPAGVYIIKAGSGAQAVFKRFIKE